MSVRSGSVDGKDDTIRIAGVCRDHGDHGSKYTLRADVSKYRPEAYKSEKLKNPKKIHRVALVELLSEIYFLFRFDDYY